jgi:hypothetical protein
MTLVLSIGMMSAVSLQLKNSGGTVVIDFSSTGNINASGNVSAGLYFVGDGRYLTNVPVSIGANSVVIAGENVTSGTIAFARLPSLVNMTTLSYKNITGTPTCSAGQYVKMNATGWICETPVLTVPANSVVIAGENVTSGTIAFARLPTLTNTHTLAYQNITGVPVCTAGQVVTMNATGWICVASASTSLTNVAYYNNTQTWALDQVFTNDINVTSDINLLSATATIKRGNTNMTIDNTGNFVITLG